MSRASSLFRLQAVDLELDRLRARSAQVRHALEDDEETRRLRTLLDQAEARLAAGRAQNKDAELAVASHRAKADATEKTLYGGTVKNPKELQDLEHELESLRRHLTVLEDRLLDTMVELEEAQALKEACERDLARALEAQAAKRGDLNHELETLLAGIERLEAEREAALASIPEGDAQTYEGLRQSRGGIAVAQVRDGGCSACGMALSASGEQAIRASQQLPRCTQCNRVLYAG
jgi:predicted  nucleic acid-binding Zn-ribbon protein